ncbi:hypothetical protein [Labrenzia sp. 011]|uniref:hypothetical protein n=1 Tax=Labrenzia sp. 011 TaxID=2171494 RepID=UPI000E3224E3|nr:hypothetical protein [Labrenzia sp. 011]
MIVSSERKKDVKLDMALCRAMFEKDPDRMIELVSEWMEANRLETSDRFRVPRYLDDMLSRTSGYSGNWRRTLAS